MRYTLLIATALALLSSTAQAADRATMFPPKAPTWGTTTTGAAAVLWTDGNKMFNSSPYGLDARSHWDVLTWVNDWLLYSGTYAVAPLEPTWITFTPAIRFLPRYGDRTWSGWSRFASQAGSGTVWYMATTDGNRMTIKELMFWSAGWITDWQEDYEFGLIDGQPALVHAWGGNRNGVDNWDITFNRIG